MNIGDSSKLTQQKRKKKKKNINPPEVSLMGARKMVLKMTDLSDTVTRRMCK